MRYEKYKPTETRWVESCPAIWECKKIAALFTQRKVKVSDKDYPALSVAKIGVVPQLDTAVKTDAGDNRKLVCAGDFVINSRSDRKGSCGVAKQDGSVSLINIVLTPRQEWNSHYVHYLLRSQPFSEEYYRYGRGIVADLWTTRYSEMKNIMLPVPPREEQDQIVRYLDWQVSKINKLIATKKKQIALLQEQKRAVINEAVTNGGEDWQRVPLKYLVKSNIASLSSKTDPELKIDYLDISAVGHGYVKQEPTSLIFSEAPSRARRIVQYGDTIISTVRTYLKSVCFISHDYENCIVSTGFSVLSPDDTKVLPELLSFMLSSDDFIDNVIKNSIGVSYPAINDAKLLAIKVSLLHSLDEQQNLYNGLKVRFNGFDKLIEKTRIEITHLNEYRSRLISDVVTGQMDVRGIEVPDFTLVEETDEAVDEDENSEEPEEQEDE